MFVAIVVPVMKTEKPVVWTVIIAAVLSSCFTYIPGLNKVSAGLAISICAIVSAGIMAVLRPFDDDESKDQVAEEGGAA